MRQPFAKPGFELPLQAAEDLVVGQGSGSVAVPMSSWSMDSLVTRALERMSAESLASSVRRRVSLP